jgi:hypothetical protein
MKAAQIGMVGQTILGSLAPARSLLPSPHVSIPKNLDALGIKHGDWRTSSQIRDRLKATQKSGGIVLLSVDGDNGSQRHTRWKCEGFIRMWQQESGRNYYKAVGDFP